jgi:septal ring factor EnvC (AmiA/AmiB activator)
MARLVCIVLLLAAAVSTAWGENPKDELKGVRQEIRAKKQLITKTRTVEASVSTELQAINRSLEAKLAELGRLNHELDSVEANLERTGREIALVTAETERKRQEIERRLVALYKAGELGAVRMFFSAESFPQMAENMRYMQSILDNDKRIFGEYTAQIAALHQLKGSLEQDMARKERIKRGIASKKQEIEQEKKNKTEYLAKVRQDRRSYEARLKELQANAARLQTMIERLETRSRQALSSRHARKGSSLKPVPELPPVPDRGFGSQKGRMSLPVRGEVVETFGKHKHAEFNSYTFSKGLSIAAAAGSEIRAIYEGNVIFADYFKGYGNMVIVDHGGGYFSLYAHAARISKKVGAEVARNEPLAIVGDTDSSRGPMLYFEIRYQGKPVDPAAWVR